MKTSNRLGPFARLWLLLVFVFLYLPIAAPPDATRATPNGSSA